MRWWRDYKRGRDARDAEDLAALRKLNAEFEQKYWRGIRYGPPKRSWVVYGDELPNFAIPWNEHPTILPMEAAVKPTQEQLEKVYEAAKMVVMELDCAESLRSGPPTTTPGESALWAAVRAAAQPRWTVGEDGFVTELRERDCLRLVIRNCEMFPGLVSRLARLLNEDDAKRGQP
jgi:hypothetical protein